MKKYVILLSLGLIFCTTYGQKKSKTNIYILKNANIINGIDENGYKQGTLFVEGMQIKEIIYEKDPKIPKGAITIDLEGKYIIPGLIDAHVHFGTDPSNKDNLTDTKKRLAYLLENGITAVRDMAGDTRYLAFLARSASLNEIPSPDLYYSALMAGRSFFDDPRTHTSGKGAQPGDCSWMKAVDLHTDMKLAVAEAKGTGATGIKIYADLGIDVIRKIVDEAALQNIKVWSHATVFPAKPLPIVDAGVEVVSHATLIAWQGVNNLPSSAKERYIRQQEFDLNQPIFDHLFKLMKQKGTILDATLTTYKRDRFDKSIYTRGIALTRLAYKKGIKIAVGTDVNLSPLPKVPPLFQEMEILTKEVGMTPMEVIKAATITNAEAIGIEQVTGSIEINKQADLVILNNNPLEDIGNIKDILYVIKKGKIYPL